MNLKRYKHSNIHIGNLQWPRYVSNPTVQQEMNRENVVCVCVCVCIPTYTYNGILLSHKKEGNSAIGNSIHGPREYYAY